MGRFAQRTYIPYPNVHSRRVALGLIVRLFVSLTLFMPAALQGQSIKPTVTVDLRLLGYTAPTAERDTRALSFLHEAVAFLDEDTLAVSYFVRNDHPDFSRRDGTPSGPILFHSAFVDTRTGSVSAQRSWSNAGYWNALLPMDNGSFFVQANNWISVYSRDLQRLTTRKLVYPSDLLPRFEVSPSGRTLYGFQDWTPPHTRAWVTKIALLDPATLGLKQTQTTAMHSDETVSDLQVVYRVSPAQLILESYSTKQMPGTVKVPSRDSEVGKLLLDSHCTSMGFVSNSVLAIGGDCPQLILLGTGGLLSNLMADLRFSKRVVGGNFQSSRDGNSLAFALYATENRAELRAFEVNVYNVAERKIIFRSEISPSPRLKLALALSPNGSQLAVMTDSVVHIWQVAKHH
jgi:hypothetical protein